MARGGLVCQERVNNSESSLYRTRSNPVRSRQAANSPGSPQSSAGRLPWLVSSDEVKKTSRHIAAPVALRLLGRPMGIPDEGERRVGQATRFEGGIMKLMPTQQSAFRAQRMGLDEARLPVAEMELAVRKTERRAKKSRHGMGTAGLIGQVLPQNHVAAAFAMRGPSFDEPA